MNRFVVISGSSGGGKSTLLAALNQRGYATVEEPGRRIVQQELQTGGLALPWVDLAAFARRSIALAQADRALASSRNGWVFFDRGLVDAAAALDFAAGEETLKAIGRLYRYHHQVFLTPPWPEIYVTDAARRHDFETATFEYRRLLQAYSKLGYEVIVLPKVSVAARADLILRSLAQSSG
ncbi:AAA family ATPase [Bryobacter aggregatus]|uniref:AAA family ATPase n=1 Tax=Bryobacter aggregatus TaxID=360054 RepID=UPI0004E254F8|nr:AAA family ATPase [Bryobacter aggregatus]